MRNRGDTALEQHQRIEDDRLDVRERGPEHGELFAQKYVQGIGHCAITPDEKLAALEELRAWKRTGKRPSPGLLRVP